MIPQDDNYPETIDGAIRALLGGGLEAGREALTEIAYPVRDLPRHLAVPRGMAARLYLRDRFTCRYCGGRVILTAIMELLSGFYPDIFPFHPNWKGGRTHPAIISRSAVVDHIDPGAWGGDWLSESNLVTACWPCNARKGDLTLTQLAWAVQPIAQTSWVGLTDVYPALWRAAGRPNPTLHTGWMRALALDGEK
ncbi:MAG: HNH endonuclease [Candidatus Dormibacteria bacterium]